MAIRPVTWQRSAARIPCCRVYSNGALCELRPSLRELDAAVALLSYSAARQTSPKIPLQDTDRFSEERSQARRSVDS